MRKRSRILIGGVAAAVIAGGAGAAVAVSAGGDSDVPVTGDAYDRATAAALEHTGGGTVTDTEVGDEEGAYEIEVRLEDGTSVDVHLDEGFAVISSEPDSDSFEDEEDGDDD